MRANKKFGVLSDQYIKENYADCFLPIAVDKLHAVRQKPAESYVNTSGRRIKEYNSIAPVIPQFVAENNIKKLGIPGQEEAYAIKSDLIRRAATAKSNYSILQPPRKRQGALQQDLGFAQISSMANAQDPEYGELDPTFVEDELNEQAPLGSSGLRASFNTMLGMEASRAKEDMSFAGKGVKPDLAEILDPSIITKMYIAGELQRQPESALFVKPQKGKKIEQQQTDLLPTDEITDQARTMGSYQAAPAPPPQAPPPQAPPMGQPIATPPAAATNDPVMLAKIKKADKAASQSIAGKSLYETLSEEPAIKLQGDKLVYYDEASSRSMIMMNVGPPVSDITAVKEFLAEELRTDKLESEAKMKKYLDSTAVSAAMIKRIYKTYFPRTLKGVKGVKRSK